MPRELTKEELQGKRVVYLLELQRTKEWLEESINTTREWLDLMANDEKLSDEERQKGISTLRLLMEKQFKQIEKAKAGTEVWEAVDGKTGKGSYQYIKEQAHSRNQSKVAKARVNRGLMNENASTWIGCEVIGWD